MDCPEIDDEYQPRFGRAWAKLTESQQERAVVLLKEANAANEKLVRAQEAANRALEAMDAAYIRLARHLGLPRTFFGAE